MARITAIPRVWAEAMDLPIHDWIMLKSSVLGDEERRVPVYELRMTFGPIVGRPSRPDGAWFSRPA